MEHITVLQNEAIETLALRSGSIVVDATFGAGGHARSILAHLDSSGTYIGIDLDPTAIAAGTSWVTESPVRTHLVEANFRDISSVLDELNIAEVDAILADLGWRTDQFLAPGRGFSFHDETALEMTYGDATKALFTAYDVVNEWEEESLANVIFGYGEERFSRRIAAAIVNARTKAPITTAAALAEIVSQAIPYKSRGKIHPATKTFQALRIAVNDEFSALQTFIAQSFTRLRPGGRLAIISFHSLEDRIVKHAFRSLSHDYVGVLVHKKPILPSDVECLENPRSRSAKLRTIAKL